MPIYYIDTDDGERAVADDDGQDLADDASARRLALEALLDLAAETMVRDDRRTISAHVRDADGTLLYAAEITLRGAWGNGRSAVIAAVR